MKNDILTALPGRVSNLPGTKLTTISGYISITGLSHVETLKDQIPVQLFENFKDNKYKIGFSFKGIGFNREDTVLFDMNTILKKNGKVVGASTHSGWPWLPGDMFVPVEAFDFIPMLQKEGIPIIEDLMMSTLIDFYEIILDM